MYWMRVHIHIVDGRYLRIANGVGLMDATKDNATDFTLELYGNREVKRAVNYDENVVIRTSDGDAFFKVVEGDRKLRGDDYFLQALFAYPVADPFRLSPIGDATSPVMFSVGLRIRLPPPADVWFWHLPAR
jgi:hypothetical protein